MLLWSTSLNSRNLKWFVPSATSSNFYHVWPLDIGHRLTPALESGRTHLVVTSETAAEIVALLQRQDDLAQYLAFNALAIHERLLCPTCIREFWAATLEAYRKRFGFHAGSAARIKEELQMNGFVLTPIEEITSWFLT